MQFETRRTQLLAALILVGMLTWQFAGSTLAQDNAPTNTATRTITVSGQGEVESRPDTAFVSVSVVTEAEEAATALDQNNSQVQSVIDTLLENGVADADIKTQSVRLDPVFAQPGPQESSTPATTPTQQITGYRATNMLQIRVTDLANLGSAIDTAVGAGANQVQGIRFEVSNPNQRMDEARMAAWQDAQRKAQQLADLAEASLGQVIEIRSTDQGAAPYAQEFLAADAAVPIRPGTQTLSTSLQVTWQLEAATQGSTGNDGETTMPTSGMAPDELIQQVTEQLAGETNLDLASIAVVSAERVEWADASLGCPQSGQLYPQVITPGYRIVLEAEGQQYEFHTSALPGPNIVRCATGKEGSSR